MLPLLRVKAERADLYIIARVTGDPGLVARLLLGMGDNRRLTSIRYKDNRIEVTMFVSEFVPGAEAIAVPRREVKLKAVSRTVPSASSTSPISGKQGVLPRDKENLSRLAEWIAGLGPEQGFHLLFTDKIEVILD